MKVNHSKLEPELYMNTYIHTYAHTHTHIWGERHRETQKERDVTSIIICVICFIRFEEFFLKQYKMVLLHAINILKVCHI